MVNCLSKHPLKRGVSVKHSGLDLDILKQYIDDGVIGKLIISDVVVRECKRHLSETAENLTEDFATKIVWTTLGGNKSLMAWAESFVSIIRTRGVWLLVHLHHPLAQKRDARICTMKHPQTLLSFIWEQMTEGLK